MGINKRYALFDWDNTVRRGYTLFSWVEYLCTRGIIASYLQEELYLDAQQYARNLITHDQYAYIACSKYASALKGMNTQVIYDAIPDYLIIDRNYLFAEIGTVFDLLYTKGIDIIVISGAPFIILEKYKEEFHIKKIFAFTEQICDGVFTGGVKHNYGFSKERKIIDIFEEYKEYPYLAFGDSESDKPMLNCAQNAFCIDYALRNDKYVNINAEKFSSEIIKKIKQL